MSEQTTSDEPEKVDFHVGLLARRYVFGIPIRVYGRPQRVANGRLVQNSIQANAGPLERHKADVARYVRGALAVPRSDASRPGERHRTAQ